MTAVGRNTPGDARSGEKAPASTENRPRSHAPGDGGAPLAEIPKVKEHIDRRRRRFLPAAARRLGSVESTLLALIALGVAITAVMAIVNP